MKILMLGWEFPPHITGGLGTACEGLLRGFASARPDVNVEFVLPSTSGDELVGAWSLTDASRQRRSREATQNITANSGAAKPGAYSVVAEQVSRFADDALEMLNNLGQDFDLIHAHDWLTFPAALAIKAVTGKPLVAQVHSTVFDRNESPDRHILGIEYEGLMAADKVIAVSHYTKKVLVDRFLLPPSKIRVVHNGWIESAQASNIGIATRSPLVSFLGRITYQKGPYAFIHAAREVLNTVPDAHFVMAGDGDLLVSCRRLVASLGIVQHFTFPGFLGRGASAALLAKSAAFVMPSISEPFGIVALEAAAQGAPLVLSNCSGVAEVVSAAVLVDPSDHRAIAKAVCQLLLDRSTAARLASQARIEATGMRWEISARKIADLYEDLSPSNMRAMAITPVFTNDELLT